MLSDLKIYEMTEADAKAASALEEECFPDAWSPESMAETIRGKASYYLGAEWKGEFAGFVGSQVVIDEGDILRVAVRSCYRGKGIGSALLEELWRRTPQVTKWTLDVREGNMPAQALYRKYGFTVVGRRKKYYHQPEEDALVMLRESNSESLN